MTSDSDNELRIVRPIYYRVVRREASTWYFRQGKVFHRADSDEDLTDFASILKRYGIKKHQIAFELFRINGGKAGFYLANIRDKKYYYCGESLQDVKQKLLDLGIGRADPTAE